MTIAMVVVVVVVVTIAIGRSWFHIQLTF